MNRLEQLRKSKKYTQGDMANLLGVSRTTYTKYERGGIQLGQDVIIRLSDIFEVSADYLLERTNNPSVPENTGAISDMQFAVKSKTKDFSDDEWADLNAQADLIIARRNRK